MLDKECWIARVEDIGKRANVPAATNRHDKTPLVLSDEQNATTPRMVACDRELVRSERRFERSAGNRTNVERIT